MRSASFLGAPVSVSVPASCNLPDAGPKAPGPSSQHGQAVRKNNPMDLERRLPQQRRDLRPVASSLPSFRVPRLSRNLETFQFSALWVPALGRYLISRPKTFWGACSAAWKLQPPASSYLGIRAGFSSWGFRGSSNRADDVVVHKDKSRGAFDRHCIPQSHTHTHTQTLNSHLTCLHLKIRLTPTAITYTNPSFPFGA